MVQDNNCIFCRIVSGDSPCHKVFESPGALAFMDIYPAADGHVLVLPRQHFEHIFEITDEDMRAVAAAARRIACAQQRLLHPDGLSVVQANGAAAGQTIMHYHVHLLPRVSGQKLRLHGPRPGDPERLAALAEQLADQLRAIP